MTHNSVPMPTLKDLLKLLLVGAALGWAAVACAQSPSPPTRISPYVTKSGQVVCFIAQANTYPYPASAVKSVAAQPTISVQFGGQGAYLPVTLGTQIYTPTINVTNPPTGLPCVFYQLLCGPVQSVVVQKGGAGYAAPTVSWSGGGGTGLVFGTPVVTGGAIVSVPVVQGGSGFTSQPVITITDAAGTGAQVASIMGGVGPLDFVQYSASAAWLTAVSGPASAAPSTTATGDVANYSGQLEPGYCGFPGFNLPTSQRTIGLGYNVGQAVSLKPYANWITMTSGVGGAITSGYDRRPLTIKGTAAAPSLMTFAGNPSTTSGIDAKYMPIPQGTWTLVVDEMNAAKPLSVAVTSTGNTCNISAPTFTEGTPGTGLTGLTLVSGGSGYQDQPIVTIEGGGGTGAKAYAIVSNGTVIQISVGAVGSGYTGIPTVSIVDPNGTGSGAFATAGVGPVIVGRKWQWTITAKSSGVLPWLSLNFWAPGLTGTYPYSWANEWMFDPAGTAAGAVRTDQPVGADTTAALTTPGGRGPSIMRFMDSTMNNGGTCNIVEAEDLKSELAFNYYELAPGLLSPAQMALAPTKSRTFNIVGLRTYAPSSTATYPWPVTWSSPNVYTNQWGSPNTTWAGYGPSCNGGPFQISPPDASWLSYGIGSNAIVAFEAVTSTPHNLKCGQLITVSGTDPFSISDGVATVLTGSKLWPGPFLVYPTSGTTFAFQMSPHTPPHIGSGASMPGGINVVAGNFAVNYVGTIVAPEPNLYASALPYSSVAKIAGSFPGCELWVNIPQAATDACVAVIARQIRDNFPAGRKVHVEYSNENWNLGFVSIAHTYTMGALGAWPGGNASNRSYATRASQIHSVFVQVFGGRSSEIVRTFGSWYSVPASTTQSIVTWANSQNILIDEFAIAPYQSPPADFSSAAQRLATSSATSPAYVATNPWTKAAYADLLRHWVAYNLGNALWNSQTQTILKTYTAGPTPTVIDYEGGLNNLVPGTGLTTVDPNGFYLYGQLSHDLYYDPNIYDVDQAYYISRQQWGATKSLIYTYCSPLGGSGAGVGAAVWPNQIWTGQPVGRGLSNQFWSTDRQSHHDVNEAVRIKAWQDWIDSIPRG